MREEKFLDITLLIISLLNYVVDHLVNNAGVGGDPTLIEECSHVTKYTSIMVSYFLGDLLFSSY
jgi:hypothetical protein